LPPTTHRPPPIAWKLSGGDSTAACAYYEKCELKATQMKVGLPINFGPQKVEFKRLVF